MAFVIEDGNGGSVTVDEPERASFGEKLAGGVEFTLAHLVYKVLEFAGRGMGSFLSGAAVEFLERVEPSLVHYARPLIDLMLDLEDLDPTLREFFAELREPKQEAAGMLLGGFAVDAGGAVMGSVVNSLMAKVTFSINRKLRYGMPGVNDILNMHRFGDISRERSEYALSLHGFTDETIDEYFKITRARLGPSELLELWKRGELDAVDMHANLSRYGYTDNEIESLLTLQQSYAPPAQLMLAMFRGEVDEDEVVKRLRAMGYHGDDLIAIMKTAEPIPGPGDLVRFGVREAWRDDIAKDWNYDEDLPPELGEYLAKHGYNPEWAIRYWRAHWALPSVQQGFEMMHRGIIQPEMLQQLLRVLDIPRFWRESLTAMSYRTLTRVDIRRMHAMGVLNDEQVKRSYLDFGYSPENAQRMLDFTIRFNDNDPESPRARTLELSRSVIIQAYQRGLIDNAEAQTRLLNAGYGNEDTTLILSLADWQGEIDRTPNYYNEHHRDVKAIIERAYSRRLLGEPEARSGLVAIGYTSAEAQLLLLTIDLYYDFEVLETQQRIIGNAYVSRSITRVDAIGQLGNQGIPGAMQEQLLAEWDSERTVRDRRLTEAQYRRAVNQNVISVENYRENLRGLGYTEGDIEILVQTYFTP